MNLNQLNFKLIAGEREDSVGSVSSEELSSPKRVRKSSSRSSSPHYKRENQKRPRADENMKVSLSLAN